MLFVLLLSASFAASQPPAECADAASCRQAALAAAAERDYERFHDLAWRAVQKGKPGDPELMQLLARAQSLSGRPGDALVMLRRLAQMGVPTDARESEDFQRVRGLPAWPDLEALIERAASNPSSAATPPATAATPTKAATPPPPEAAARAAKPVPSASEKTTAKNFAKGAIGAAPEGEDALRLTETAIDPVGLAYDSASQRFVLGDRRANKLIVADDVFKHVNDLIGASAGGFGVLGAVEIDGRRGDLWVTSTDTAGRGSLHKLQLVSGRLLSTIAVPDALQPATFADISIGDGGLLLLDAEGRRLMRVRPAASDFDKPVALDLAAPSSICASGNIVYVAHEAGLSRLDPASGQLTAVRAPDGVSLAGLRRIRADRGTLIAIQGSGEGPSRLVRITFVRGRPDVRAVQPLDAAASVEGSALTISRDAAYYVAQTAAGPIIRRVRLR